VNLKVVIQPDVSKNKFEVDVFRAKQQHKLIERTSWMYLKNLSYKHIDASDSPNAF